MFESVANRCKTLINCIIASSTNATLGVMVSDTNWIENFKRNERKLFQSVESGEVMSIIGGKECVRERKTRRLEKNKVQKDFRY